MTTPSALSLYQVAARLGVSYSTVYALVTASKKLRGFKVGGTWRVDVADLEAFIADSKAATAPIARADEAPKPVADPFDPDAALGPIPAECRL